MVVIDNVLLSMEIHHKEFLKFPSPPCCKCYSNLVKSKVDFNIPAASKSLFEDKRPSSLRDMKSFIQDDWPLMLW